MELLKDLGKRTLIMGILNVTPDSFSDGGQYATVEKALEHARKMIADGADILDIGGESTRPGFTPVSAEEELQRLLPVIQAIREAGITVPISVDTYKGIVAQETLKAGADIINDIWGGMHDPLILQAAAETGAPIILTHNRKDMNYGPDLVKDVADDLREMVRRAKEAGVREEQIILDPGIGFAKNGAMNLQVMNRLKEITALGYPVLLGTSRKRFIRETIGGQPNEVLEGTLATTVIGIVSGVHIVRVHDVKENAKAARMTDAILAAKAPPVEGD